MSGSELKWRNEDIIKTPEEMLENYDLNAGILEAKDYINKNIAEAIIGVDSIDIGNGLKEKFKETILKGLNIPEIPERLQKGLSLEYLETVIWIQNFKSGIFLADPISRIARIAYELTFAVNGKAAGSTATLLSKSIDSEFHGFTPGGMLSHFVRAMHRLPTFVSWLETAHPSDPKTYFNPPSFEQRAERYNYLENNPLFQSQKNQVLSSHDDVLTSLRFTLDNKYLTNAEFGRLIKILQLYPELYQPNTSGECFLDNIYSLWAKCSRHIFSKIGGKNEPWDSGSIQSLTKLLEFRTTPEFKLVNKFSPTTLILERDLSWVDPVKEKKKFDINWRNE